MKSVWKTLAYRILILGLIVGLIAVPVKADEIGNGGPEPAEVPEQAQLFGDGEDSADSASESGGLLMEWPTGGGTDPYAEVRQAIYDGLFARQETIDLSAFSLPDSELSSVFDSVLYDSPELIFVAVGQPYQTTSTSAGIVLSITPTYNENYGDEHLAEFHAVCESIHGEMEEGWSDLQKLLFLHDYLVTHCEYDSSHTYYTAYDALVRHTAVCQGYSLAYIYLCRQEGFTITMVTSKGLEHAWNLVTLGEEQFYVDCTWDDPVAEKEGESYYEAYCSHKYFLRSRDAFGHTGKNTASPITDWSCGGENIYMNDLSSHRYDGAWFIHADTAIPMIGSVAAYAISDNSAESSSHVYLRDLSAAATANPVKVALSRPSQWLVWGTNDSAWSGNYTSLARMDGDFYYTTPTEIWRLSTAGSPFHVYTLTPAEQEDGYLYGMVNEGGKLYYSIGKAPVSDSYIRAALNLSTAGSCGKELTWSFSDGTLTFSGAGAMTDYPSEASVPWYALREEIASVELSADITYIGTYAFSCCRTLAAAHYGGTDEQWRAVTVGDFNIPLIKALAGSGGGTLPPLRVGFSLTDMPTTVEHRVQSKERYVNWAGVSSVSQFLDEAGRFCFAVDEGGQVTVYRTDQGSVISSVSIPNPYNSFGGAVCGSDGYLYLVWGFNNDTEEAPDTSVATIIVGKYTADGTLLGYAEGNGSEGMPNYYPERFYTKTPFLYGNCDVAINGGTLLVNYAREMYSGHQANTVFAVNTEDMTVKTGINSYNSHSFDQRVTPYGKTGFLLESHGDCIPRNFTTALTDGSKTLNEMNTFSFWVEEGAYDAGDMFKVNTTRARLGNILETNFGAALVAASVRSLSEDALNEPYDLFIQVFDPTGSAADPNSYVTEGVRSGTAGRNGDTAVTDYGVKFLTDLAATDPGKSVDAVQAVSIDNDRILVLYELYDGNGYYAAYDSTWCMLLDGSGAVLQDACSLGSVRLNLDEDPVFAQGAVWWVSNAAGSDELALHRLEIVSSRNGSFGEGRELVWELWKGNLTVSGLISEAAPVVAAFFAENGSMLSARIFTESDMEAPVAKGAAKIRLFCLDSGCSPLCSPAAIALSD